MNGPRPVFYRPGRYSYGAIMDIQPIGNAVTQSHDLANQSIAAAGTTATKAVATPTSGVPEQSDAQQPSSAQLSQAVASINQTMQKLAPGLEFFIDQESNRTIVKVVDKETNELIRQMPSAETMEIAKAMDRVQGLLMSLRA
jgi:flagellar protein FlaG